MTNNGPQTSTLKTKHWVTRIPRVFSYDPEGHAVSVPLMYFTNVSKIELMNLLHENPCFAGVRRNDYESEI